MSMSEARAIEEFFRRRYSREALYLPSGRAALYLAFREWLQPGDRLLMSPVTDDVVFFVVLAAGLVPVLGPIDPQTGNLDVAAIPDSTWSQLRAVMTTNLYGVPDRADLLADRCQRHGLVLLEDAAHAFDSHCAGRRIGQFGDAAAFSLHKHLGVVGGVLLFPDSARRAALERHAAREIRQRPLHLAIAHRARAALSAVARTRAGRGLARLRDRIVRPAAGRSGHRMAYDLATLQQLLEQGGGLDRLDRWVRVDDHLYRVWTLRHTRRLTLRQLSNWGEDRRRRLAGTARLLNSGLAGPMVRLPSDTALFRVPLFVKRREEVRDFFAKDGLALDYIYDPPLDVYAPELIQQIPSPRPALHWTRDILPVDPLFADRFVARLCASRRSSQPLVEPLDWLAQPFAAERPLDPVEAP
jgi:hypothetical protein